MAEVISSSAFHEWLCDEEPLEPVAPASGSHHQQTVSRKIKLTELNYPTNVPQTGSKGTDPHKTDTYKKCLPGGPGTRRKVQKANVASSSLGPWRDVPQLASFPSWQNGALVTA